MAEIRLEPGTYKVKTEAAEGTRKAIRWQTIKVKVKADRSTLSKGEYRRIKKSMTKAKVRRGAATLSHPDCRCLESVVSPIRS